MPEFVVSPELPILSAMDGSQRVIQIAKRTIFDVWCGDPYDDISSFCPNCHSYRSSFLYCSSVRTSEAARATSQSALKGLPIFEQETHSGSLDQALNLPLISERQLS
jgi:hypothetical protein